MKRLSGILLTLVSVALAAPLSAQSITWEIDSAHSSAQFSVRHMMVSNVRGDFGKVSGTASFDGKDTSTVAVDVTIDAASLNTRVGDRDKHLKSPDFLDVEKHPTITFKSKRAESVGRGRFRLIGDLTIRGITKEVALETEGPTPEVKDQQGTVRIGATATTRINRKDFNVLWNRALDGGGLVVGDEVAITIDVELVKKAAAATEASTR